MWNCDSRGGFKAKVDELRERLQEGELWQLNGTRQSTENIARIALSGLFKLVKYVWMLIAAGLLKVKLERA